MDRPRSDAARSGTALTGSCALVAVLISFGLWRFATGGLVAYTMDSLTYRDVALNFLHGNYWMASNVASEMPRHVPFTVWPPAYSALWAAVSYLFHLDIDAVPQVLNPVLLLVTVLALFCTVMMSVGRPVVAGVIATAFAFVPVSLAVYGNAWSETLCTPFFLAAYAAFLHYLKEPQPHKKIAWLAVLALAVGAANWTRYSAAILIPLSVFCVLLAPGLGLAKRLAHALGLGFFSLALVSPLWARNYFLVGAISGSNRGGAPRNVTARLMADLASTKDMLENSLFNFDVSLQATLEPLLVLALAIGLLRYGKKNGLKSAFAPKFVLPVLWASASVGFLLFARCIQKELDMDFRMLAGAVPFCLLALARPLNHALSHKAFGVEKIIPGAIVGLIVFTGWGEASRVHANHANNRAAAWRGSFAMVYRDLSQASRSTRAIEALLGRIPTDTLLLADYRALYMRYLSGAQAFEVNSLEGCSVWVRAHDGGILFTGRTGDVLLDNPKAKWATACGALNPSWKVIEITGQGAHSLFLDD